MYGVFRNIFPFQAHQRNVHQVGRGNVRRRRPGEQKGKELMNQVCINENILITNFVFIQIFFLFHEPPTFSTSVNEGKKIYSV
jgi:hypothetical protein